MSLITITGVDPGLVHTGVVILRLHTREKWAIVEYFVIEGKSHAFQVRALLKALEYDERHIFIEAYRERGQSYGTNPAMRELMTEFRREIPKAKIIDNTGVRKVVLRPLLRVLELHDFPTTHHQDLQAAARILVYGMLKDDRLNAVLTQVLTDHLDGHTWPVDKP